MTQMRLLFDDTCPHARSTVSAQHQPCADGRSCNHDETCDACGVIVATESWNHAIGSTDHARAYPEPV